MQRLKFKARISLVVHIALGLLGKKGLSNLLMVPNPFTATSIKYDTVSCCQCEVEPLNEILFFQVDLMVLSLDAPVWYKFRL